MLFVAPVNLLSSGELKLTACLLYGLYFKFPLILIIAIPRTPAEFDDVRILKTTTEVLGMFLDNGFALNRLLRYKCSAFGNTYPSAVLLRFTHALADT